MFDGGDRSETDPVELLCSDLRRCHFRRAQGRQLCSELARIVIPDKGTGLDIDLRWMDRQLPDAPINDRRRFDQVQ